MWTEWETLSVERISRPCRTLGALQHHCNPEGRWGNDKNTSRWLHPTTSWLGNHYRSKVINKPPCQLWSSLFYIGAHSHAQHCFAMWVQTDEKWHPSTIVLSVSVSLRLTLVVLELLCSMLYAGHSCLFVLIVLDSFFLLFSFISLTPKRQLSSMSVMLSCISPPQRLLVLMGRGAEQVGEVAAVWAKHGGSTRTHTSLRPPPNNPLTLFKLCLSVSAWTQQNTWNYRRKMSNFCHCFLQTVNPAQPKQPPTLPFSNFPPLCLLMFLLPTSRRLLLSPCRCLKCSIIAFPGLISILNVNPSHLRESRQPQLDIILVIFAQHALAPSPYYH